MNMIETSRSIEDAFSSVDNNSVKMCHYYYLPLREMPMSAINLADIIIMGVVH